MRRQAGSAFRSRSRTLAVLTAAALGIAACSSGSGSTDFSPSPSAPDVEGRGGVHIEPVVPTPAASGTGSNGRGASRPDRPSGTSSSGSTDSLVVATGLTAPTGLSLLPDGTALVGERTTGRIVRVQPHAGRPVPTVKTITGLSTAGGGGLLDLAVSPDYGEDDLVYALITTARDTRVVDFTLDGPVVPVLTGIPRGASDNAGRLAFGADGDLYVATGDAGTPSAAANRTSLAGKILRLSDIGQPADGNPDPRSPVFARGLRTSPGLCPSDGGRNVYRVGDGGGGRPVAIDVVRAGAYYGWPTTASARAPLGTLPARFGTPGGCAVQAGRLWITSLDGRTLLSTPLLDATSPRLGTEFSAVLTNRFGRLRTVVAAPDGALWLTTSNRDGQGRPVAADERVIRYPPEAVGGEGGRTT